MVDVLIDGWLAALSKAPMIDFLIVNLFLALPTMKTLRKVMKRKHIGLLKQLIVFVLMLA